MRLQRIVGELAEQLAEMHVASAAEAPVEDGVIRLGGARASGEA